MDALTISVPDLIREVKRFVGSDDQREQLDELLGRYTSRSVGKQQLQLELRLIAGRDALRSALVLMVPRVDEMVKQRKEQQQLAAVQRQLHQMEHAPKEGDECPVCYECFPAPSESGDNAPIVCTTCSNAICKECDASLRASGHRKCPMCRAPWTRPTMPVEMLIHGFHCENENCAQRECAEVKQVLRRMELHVTQCPHGPGSDCKVCKLWMALNCSALSRPQQENTRPPGATSVQRVRQVLLRHQHQAGCRPSSTRRCDTCRRLRLRVRELGALPA